MPMVSGYTTRKGLCHTCRSSTAECVASQAASQKVSGHKGVVAAILASVALHCTTKDPEIEKNQDRPPGMKCSIEIEKF